MNTSVLMVLSALFMAVLGAIASFMPQEILAYSGTPANGVVVLIVQITGALYLGFAFLNWTARGNIMGGIYSRPVALGNFLHFVVASLAIWKMIAADQNTTGMIIGAVVNTAFAVSFGLVLFRQPRVKSQ